jgi:hypothetical protein
MNADIQSKPYWRRFLASRKVRLFALGVIAKAAITIGLVLVAA